MEPLIPSSAKAKRKGRPLASPEPQHANQLLPWPKRHQPMSGGPLLESDWVNRQQSDVSRHHSGPIAFPLLEPEPDPPLPLVQRHHSSAGKLSSSGGPPFGGVRPPLRRLTSLPRLRHPKPPLLHPQPRSATTSIGPHFARESAMRSTCASGGEAPFAFSFQPSGGVGGIVDDPSFKWRGPMLAPISPTHHRSEVTSPTSVGGSFPFPPIHTAPALLSPFPSLPEAPNRHRSLSNSSHVAHCFAGLALKDSPHHAPSLSISSSNSSLATSAHTLPTPALSAGGLSDNEGRDDDELLGSDEEMGGASAFDRGPSMSSGVVAPSLAFPNLRPALDHSIMSGLTTRLQSSIRLHRRLKHFLTVAHRALELTSVSHLALPTDMALLLTTRLDADDHAQEPTFQLGSFKRPVAQSDDGHEGDAQAYDVAIHRALCFGEIIADAIMMTTPRTTAAAASGAPTQTSSSGGGGTPQSLQIACIRLGESYWITSTDICRLLRFRLVAIGWEILDQTKLFEGVYSDLRTVPKSSIRLELPCSPLVATLFELGCVATLKAQKLYEWRAVEHDALLLEAMQRSLDRARRGEEKLACKPGPDGFKLQGGDAGRPLPRQLGITRHTSQSSTAVASPSRSLTPAGLAKLVLGSDTLYRLSYASEASLTLDGKVSIPQAAREVVVAKPTKPWAAPSVPFPALEEEPEVSTASSSVNRPRRRLAPRRLDAGPFPPLPFLR